MTAAPSVRPLFELVRPGVIALVVFSALPVAWGHGADALPALVGTLLVAAACSALNAYLERDRDARMARTRGRPLPSGRLAPGVALAFGVCLTAAGVGTLLWCGVWPAVIAAVSTAIYVGPYTVWLKPRSAWNTVVGALPSASAPLIVDAALGGTPGFWGWWLFAVVFAWQLPHVWSIALVRAEEYAAAGVVMLPARVGDVGTRRRILAWACVVLALTLVPAGRLGLAYAVVAAVSGGWAVRAAARACREESRKADRNVFLTSLAHLMVVCGAVVLFR